MLGFTVPEEYIYILITLPFFVLWTALFVFYKRTRKEQAIVSLIFIPVGVFVENVFYLKDYWSPFGSWELTLFSVTIFPEFLLFGAFFAGIASVLYEISFGLCLKKLNTNFYLSRKVRLSLILLILVWMFGFIYIGLNSIFATALGALVFVGTVVFLRRDLLKPAFVSGLLVMFVQFFLYLPIFTFTLNIEDLLSSIWYLYGTNLDIRILSIPFTELFWGFSVGASVGVFYKFARNLCYSRPT